ncbi:uncharacterized protein LOC112537242 isoform X1 [Ricinus communis]|uniref:uncharacterized protein LOC112537242 isoform X1 n=1 Tax=Ricinus communis TaxID=3988 RepID=UPI00201A5D12|nr:uncharacterized protein LOC112537242 isoform X1 [Ricinus communis]
MRLPECLEEVSVLVGYLFLGEICGSLAVIHAKQKEYKVFEGIDVWVGKDCGWNKVYVVGDAITGTLGSLIGLSGSGSGLLLAIGCKESDERELVQFDLKSNRTKKLGITSAMGAIYAGSYIDSLLLFNDDSGAISFQEIEPKEL